VKNGVLTAIETDDLINPGLVNEDFSTLSQDDMIMQRMQQRGCAMGRSWRQDFYDPRRVMYPMKNTAPPGEARRNPRPGKLVRISWQEALDSVANAMKETKEKWGPMTYDDNAAVRRGQNPPSSMHYFYNMGVCGHGQMSSQAWYTAAWFHLGITGAATHGMPSTSILDAKGIVFWGKNMASWHGGQCPYWYRQAHEKGIPFIIVDPRYTYESEVYADQWIPMRPQMDVPFLLAIMNVLIKENLYDTAFVAAQVEPTGFQKFKDYVLGNAPAMPVPKDPFGFAGKVAPDGTVTGLVGPGNIGDINPVANPGEKATDRTPEWAAPICGVPADTIRAFARWLGQNKGKLNLQFGLGFQRREYGEDCCSAAACLTIMLGELGHTWDYGIGSGQNSGTPTIVKPSITSYFARKNYTYMVPNTMDIRDNVSTAVLLRPLYEQGKVTAEEVNHLLGGLVDDPIVNIKMMFYSRGFMTPANLNNTIRSVKSLPYLIWTLGQYSTNVIYNYADWVLPTPNAFFEQEEFETGGGDGQDWFVWHPAIVPLSQQGEIRDLEWVKVQLGRRLTNEQGVMVSSLYNPTMANITDYQEWCNSMHTGYQKAYETWAANAAIKPMNPPSWEEFMKKPVFRAFHKIEDYTMPGASQLKSGWAAPYAKGVPGTYVNGVYAKGPNIRVVSGGGGTTSGKVEFFNNFLAAGERQVAIRECWEGATPPMSYWEIPPDDPYSPLAVKYPLYGQLGYHSLYRQHSTHDQNPILNDEYRHAVHMNPADAKARGIRDNDTVRVFNDSGEMIIPAYVSNRITPGNISVAWGAYYKPGSGSKLNPDGIDMRGACNILTTGYYTRGNNTYGRAMVQIEKVTDGSNPDAQQFKSGLGDTI